MSGRLAEIAAVFLRISAVGFGGPNAHLAIMHDELVERRGWLSEERFVSVVGITNLLPGPNSSEVAIHLGYLRGGRPGGLVAGIAFGIPSFLAVVLLSWLYFAGSDLPLRAGVSAGLQPAVVAVLAVALWRLRGVVTETELSLGASTSLAIGALVLTLAFPGWEPLVLLGAGLIALTLARLAPGLAELSTPILAAVMGVAALPALAWVFLKTGALLFGGGYVLVPLLQPEVVGRGWLSEGQFLDGIAIGQVTPGPIVMTAAFVGYAVAGLGGAAVAAVAIYLPSFLAVLGLSGPLLDRALESRPLRVFVAGVTAAAFGAIAAAGYILGRQALTGPIRVGIFLATLVAGGLGVPVWIIVPVAGLVGVTAEVLL